ncbi:MAG: bh protein [Mahellales bacterium]|jgi:hypothetical protein
MKIDKIQVQLYCIECLQECEHIIIYWNDKLKAIKCCNCGRKLEIIHEKMLEYCVAHWVKRILTKPKRMTKELENDFKHFLLSLPIRIIKKPYKLAQEISDELHIIATNGNIDD